ncbi:pentapeptide repeat-containing protein [Streptomyces sp. HUAS MG91]|uniref:Pentapeptide repeat-containing protein n=1 Tax=Streptomyces tabacisoli TaxID=3156398 RepID=A0AAU8IU21_9ACTN
MAPTGKCLSHLSDRERASHCNSISSNRTVSYRGTVVNSELLQRITHALAGSGVEEASFDSCVFIGESIRPAQRLTTRLSFASAIFEGDARFDRVEFLRDVEFTGANFRGKAIFERAIFRAVAAFEGVRFSSWADFEDATFAEYATFNNSQMRKADFDGVRFKDYAAFGMTSFGHDSSFARVDFEKIVRFENATFDGSADFSQANFSGMAGFEGVKIAGDGNFAGAIFKETPRFGSIRCGRRLDLSNVHFENPVLLVLEARKIALRRTRFTSHASIQATLAEVDMTYAILNQPVDVIGGPITLEFATGAISERVSLTSLRGVDCAMLTVANVSLGRCTFSGAVHLDQIRLEGNWNFEVSPRGYSFSPPFHLTRRQVIAEEKRRRSYSGQYIWSPGSAPIDRITPGHGELAIIYRQLRKSREDAKDEPGAADFYYGEMEMRRLGRSWKTAERWLLQLYWLLSGYGLRASRAFGWLALTMMTTILLMMAFGLPGESPNQRVTGTVPSQGGKVTFEIEKEDPKNPSRDRFSHARLQDSVNVTLNSVVFRSSGQDLTTAGEYIEMTSRFFEPVLLGLAALAIRGRVKR